MEHDGAGNIRALRAEMSVGILADVQIERRVYAGTTARRGEPDNGELGDIQHFRDVADQLLRGGADAAAVVDVVQTAIVGSREDRASGAVDSIGQGQHASPFSYGRPTNYLTRLTRLLAEKSLWRSTQGRRHMCSWPLELAKLEPQGPGRRG